MDAMVIWWEWKESLLGCWVVVQKPAVYGTYDCIDLDIEDKSNGVLCEGLDWEVNTWTFK